MLPAACSACPLGVLRIHAVALVRFCGRNAALEQSRRDQHRHALRRIVRQLGHRDIGEAAAHLRALDRIVVEKHHAGGGQFEAIENARKALPISAPSGSRPRRVCKLQDHFGPIGKTSSTIRLLFLLAMARTTPCACNPFRRLASLRK